MYFCCGFKEYPSMTIEQIRQAHTRQLLAELRRTYMLAVLTVGRLPTGISFIIIETN